MQKNQCFGGIYTRLFITAVHLPKKDLNRKLYIALAASYRGFSFRVIIQLTI